MVKGISKQVIVVHSPDPNLFEQAIFILNENAVGREGITDEMLLREAKNFVATQGHKRRSSWMPATLFTAAGAFATGLIWLMTMVF